MRGSEGSRAPHLESHRKWTRLLCRVGMIGARVDLELSEQLAAQDALGEHSAHGLRDGNLGLVLDHALERLAAEAAGRAAVANVLLLRRLAPSESYLLRVDDDDEVARVDVRRERRLVLASEHARDATGKTTERLALGID